mmetsp:Transcript_35784/g.70476  ORF Transcript_35784/g.70476 Transcript_35784/m.70476 type:complete len:229 (+) Transcript_35784:641-1327(+)
MLSHLHLRLLSSRGVHEEPLSEFTQDPLRPRTETGQRQVLLPHHHHLDNAQEFLRFSPGLHEASYNPLSEFIEKRGTRPPHDLHKLVGQFEQRRFEWDVSGTVREHEPKVHMDHVAFAVNQNIRVVPVSDVEHVADDRVGSHRIHERLLRTLQCAPESLLVEVQQGLPWAELLDGVNGHGVGDGLYQAGLDVCGKDVEGLQPELFCPPRPPPDLLKPVEELSSKELLS